MTSWTDFNDAEDQWSSPERVNIDDLRAQLLSRLPDVLFYLFPHGQIRGHQFYIGNIKGDKGDSLVFTLEGDKAGLWHDFATGEGGDVFALWAASHKLDIKHQFPEVVSSIREWLGCPTSFMPIPNRMQKKSVYEDDLGRYSYKWDYFDINSRLIACMYRYDTENGKVFRPWDVLSRKMQAPNPRPLYNQPQIKDATSIILVEGEKCADALISIGLCATTAMMGANAPIDKTNWSPLKGKHVIIWPDHDEAGYTYAERVATKLKTMGVASIAILNIPKEKPIKWDAADAVDEGLDIHAFLSKYLKTEHEVASAVSAYSVGHLLDDTSPMPEDIIAPRVLTPGGLLVFGGAPKVGKSDLLLSLLAHMASGVSFLGMRPPRPLRIFYLQAEIGYHYLRERLQNMKFDQNLLPLVRKNLVITPQFKMLLNEDGVNTTINIITQHFHQPIDIIVVDPLRNIFDGGNSDAGENDNAAMLFFLQQRLDVLRDQVNPDAGIILAHHTRKIEKKKLEEDPFQALSGASSLRGYYTTGMIMFQPDEQQSNRQIIFELRNGPRLNSKYIDKVNGSWQEIEQHSERLVNQNYGQKLDAERRRKRDVILQIIYDEALAGRVYTMNQFCQAFENHAGLGGETSIRKRLEVLSTKGYIKFFKDIENYDLPRATRTKYGYMCVEDMRLATGEESIDQETGEVSSKLWQIYPSHYKCKLSAAVLPVENIRVWVYDEEDE